MYLLLKFNVFHILSFCPFDIVASTQFVAVFVQCMDYIMRLPSSFGLIKFLRAQAIGRLPIKSTDQTTKTARSHTLYTSIPSEIWNTRRRSIYGISHSHNFCVYAKSPMFMFTLEVLLRNLYSVLYPTSWNAASKFVCFPVKSMWSETFEENVLFRIVNESDLVP